jgi:beta-phosphoglucomutase-like phosphatase (HAD superfamily)
MTMMQPAHELRLAGLDCAIFDMDGVITDTALTHATAWKQLFDEFWKQRRQGRHRSTSTMITVNTSTAGRGTTAWPRS